MKRKNIKTCFRAGTAALLAFAATGCAFTVVRPTPLIIGSKETGDMRVIEYPPYVLTHDTGSAWDAHAIKDNIVGLFDGEVVHWVDMGIDAVTPGPRHRPVENGIEWIKNSYAQLPDCAPVRIVDGLFSALALEKTTVIKGGEIAVSPAAPLTHFGFLRVIYLTDWIQETLGELNTAGGYLVPWQGPLVPYAATAPLNRCVDATQTGAVVLYIYVFNKINNGVDRMIDGFETAWGGFVWLFVSSNPPPAVAEAPEKPIPKSGN